MIIERFEENIAVIETDDKNHINIEKSKLPKNAKEGDFIIEKNGEYIVDDNKTNELRREILELQNNLWE